MKKIITHLSVLLLLTLLCAASQAATSFSITPAGNVVFNTHAGIDTTQQITITNTTANPIYLTLTSTNPLFGISGTPTFTIGANGSRNVTLTFNPVVAGSDTGTLNVVATGGDSAAVKLIGNSLAPVSFQLIPPGPITFTTKAGVQTSDSVAIRNLTNSPLSVTLSTSGNAAFAISGSKTFTIPAMGTTQVMLTYDPQIAGNDTGSFMVASSLDTVRTKLIGVATGTAITKIQIIPDGELVFNTRAGVQTTKTIQLRNLSDSSVYVTLSTTGSNTFGISGSKTFTIAGNGSSNVTLTFTPQRDSTYTGTFNVAMANGDTVKANLKGHANITGNTRLNVSDEMDFSAERGQTQCLPVTIDNDLTSNVTISGITITGDTGEFSVMTTGPITVNAGSTSTITVCFHPLTSSNKDEEEANARLSFNFMTADSLVSGTQSVSLQGDIKKNENDEDKEDSLFFTVTRKVEFNDILAGTTSCQEIRIVNPTTQTIVIDSAMISGQGATAFTVSGASNLTIAPDSMKFINVCFTAMAGAGDQNATVTLHYTISGTSLKGTISVALEGNEIDSNNSEISNCIKIRHKEGVIGPIVLGGSDTSMIFITNTTASAVTVNGATLNGNDSGAFMISSTQFPMTIQSGQTGQLLIAFNPKGQAGPPSFGATVNLNVTGTAMTCGPVSFHIEGVAVRGNHNGGRDTNHVDLGRGLTANGTNVIGIVNTTLNTCIIDTVTFDNTTSSAILINNVVIPSNPNIQLVGSSMPFPATVAAGASLQVYVQFCNGQRGNVTFDDPMFVSTNQSIDPQTFTIQGVTLAAAGVADAAVSAESVLKLSPNPASDQISIQLSLDNAATLDLALYDAAGHFVRNIFSGRKEAGMFILPFDAKSIPSGAYVVIAKIDGTIVQTKLDVVK